MSSANDDLRQVEGEAVASDVGAKTASQCCVALCSSIGLLLFGLMVQLRGSRDDAMPPPQPDLVGLPAASSLEPHGDESSVLWSALSTFAMGVCLSVLILPSFRSNSATDGHVRRATGGMDLGDGTDSAENEPRVLALRVLLLQWHRRASMRAFCRWHLAISRAQLSEQQDMCAAHIAVLHQQRVRLLHAAGMRAREDIAAALRRIERLHLRLRTAACEAAWRRWLRASAGDVRVSAVVQGTGTVMALAPAARLRAVLLHRWRTTQRVAMAQWKAAARLQGAATKLTQSVARAVSKAEARGKREGAAAAAARGVGVGDDKGDGNSIDGNAVSQRVWNRDSARMQAATMLRTLLRSSAQLLMVRAMVQWSRYGRAPARQSAPIATRLAAKDDTTRHQLERALRSVFRVQKAPLRRAFLQWKLAARVLTTMNYSQRMMQKGRLKLEAAQRVRERSGRAQRIRFLVARSHACALRRAFTTLRLQSSEAALSAALSRQSGFMDTAPEQQQQQQLARSTHEAQAALERKELQVTSLLEQLDTRETRLSRDMAAFEERLSIIAQQHLDTSLALDGQAHPVGSALSASDMPTPIPPTRGSPDRRPSSSVTIAPFSPAPERKGSLSVTLSASALQALENGQTIEPMLYRAFWTWRIDTFSRNGTGLYAFVERALLRCALDTAGSHAGLQSHEARGREVLRGVAGATLSVRALEVRGCEQLERPLVHFSCGAQLGNDPSNGNMPTTFAITDVSQTLTVHVKDWNNPEIVVAELNVRLKVLDYNRPTRRWLPVLDVESRQQVGEVQLEMLLNADTAAARDPGGNTTVNDDSLTAAMPSVRQPLAKVRDVAGDRGGTKRDGALEKDRDDSQENQGLGGMMPVRVHLDVKKSDYRTLLLDPRKHETWTAHNIGQLMRNKLLASKPNENFDKWSLYASDDGVEIDRPIAPHEALQDVMQRTGLRLFGPNAMGKIVYQRCSRRDDANVRMTSHRKRKQRLQEMGRPRFAQRGVAAQAVHRPGAVGGSFR